MDKTELEKKEWTLPDEPADGASDAPAPLEGGKGRKTLIVVSAVIVIAAALLWFFFLRKPAETSPPVGQSIQENEVDESIAGPVGDESLESASLIPPPLEPAPCTLNESDAPLREKAAGLSSHKRLTSLLREGDLIRRFVSVTNAVALGESPARLMESLAPGSDFKVVLRDGRIYIDPASYDRYNALIAFLLSLNVDLCTDLYLEFEPQIEAAYSELGQSDPKSFLDILERAVQQLRSTPTPPDRFELVEKTLSYAYADTHFEEQNAAKKHFLRLGPGNLHQLQGKCTLMLDTLKRAKKR